MTTPQQAFLDRFPVSRETLDRLQAYVDLLTRWQASINLVGPKTLAEVWTRHLLDSAQLFPLIPPDARNLMDMGSGAGLPGLILALLGAPDVHLFEADQRKVAFLREAARVTETSVTLHNRRIEAVDSATDSSEFDVICARAFAPLPKILDMADPYHTEKTVFLLPKGQNVDEELTDTHKIWSFSETRRPSWTDDQATVLILQEVRRDPHPSRS